MDNTKFTLSKQAASPFDVTGLPAPAVNKKPPHNFVHMALGGMQQICTTEHLINQPVVWTGSALKCPTPHAPERYRAANNNTDIVKSFFKL